MTPAERAGGSGPGSDARVVAGQIGRGPRGAWRVAARCRWGRPTVIAVAPLLDGEEPFPTVLWLTCPSLSRRIDDEESAGACDRWCARMADDPELAGRAIEADARYRELRERLGGGSDPCASVGIAGQADPLAVKCLHARVAAHLGGVGDPIGEAVLEGLGAGGSSPECDDDRCRDLP